MAEHNKNGFTLIEIMLVVIIIGILVAMVVPNMSGRSQQARVTAAKTDIEANLATALDLYNSDNGHYPATDQGLQALLEKPTTCSRRVISSAAKFMNVTISPMVARFCVLR